MAVRRRWSPRSRPEGCAGETGRLVDQNGCRSAVEAETAGIAVGRSHPMELAEGRSSPRIVEAAIQAEDPPEIDMEPLLHVVCLCICWTAW